MECFTCRNNMEDTGFAADPHRAERHTDDGHRLVVRPHVVHEAAVSGVDPVEVAGDGPGGLAADPAWGGGVNDPVEAEAGHDGVRRRGDELGRALQQD